MTAMENLEERYQELWNAAKGCELAALCADTPEEEAVWLADAERLKAEANELAP